MLAIVPKPPDEAQFLQVFNRLCVALREPPDDSGVTQGVYFDALSDLPLPALDAGAVALSREKGRRFFPTTAEWRTTAEAAQQEQLRKVVQPPRSEPWHLECERCADTGWILELTCDGTDYCGRHKQHAAHTFTRACPCRPTNRTYIRHKQFGAGA
jgi:hypothetical protein